MRSTVPLTKMNLVMSDSEKWKLRLFHRWARLFSEPVIRLSIPITSCPSASRWSVRCEPRNPAAPVTTHLIVLLQCGSGSGWSYGSCGGSGWSCWDHWGVMLVATTVSYKVSEFSVA